MREFLSVLLLFVMLLGCTVVEAAKTPSLDFFEFRVQKQSGKLFLPRKAVMIGIFEILSIDKYFICFVFS